MQWKVEFVEDGNYLKVTCEGIFLINELDDHFDKMTSAEFWKPGIKIIFDFSDIDFSQYDIATSRLVNEHYLKIGERLGCGKLALIMRTSLSYGLGRQFQIISEGRGARKIEVFKNEEAAVKWLS